MKPNPCFPLICVEYLNQWKKKTGGYTTHMKEVLLNKVGNFMNRQYSRLCFWITIVDQAIPDNFSTPPRYCGMFWWMTKLSALSPPPEFDALFISIFIGNGGMRVIRHEKATRIYVLLLSERQAQHWWQFLYDPVLPTNTSSNSLVFPGL